MNSKNSSKNSSKGGFPPHRARKRFGQNFLIDEAIIDAIVRAIDPREGESLVEIGPGLMALTRPLLERTGAMRVIELDRDLAARLRRHSALKVIEADVLDVDFSALAEQEKLRVVGNLPYNISTPILFHLLRHAESIQDQHFMLQKEVVQRMVARPCTSDYGRLSVALQWRYEMEWVLDVPPQSFSPAPRVDSAVVRMCPRSNCEAGLSGDIDAFAGVLEELVQVAFSQRRKLLRHTLGRWLEEKREIQENFGISFDLQRRAEEVSVDEYVSLAAALQNSQK